MATLQLGVNTRNARLDAIETQIGTTPMFRIWSGALPANCAAADSGTKIAEFNLPSDWMNAAASGQKTKLGTWQEDGALADATAGHFRIYDSTGTTCYIQGDITVTSGGGALELDDITVQTGQVITINTFTLTDGNA